MTRNDTLKGTARLVAAACMLVAASAMALAQGRPAGVGVAEVERRSLTETVPVFAEIVASRDGIIAARVAGTVDAVHVLEGSAVAEGAPLATLDTNLARIELRQTGARVAEARAGIQVATARLNRLETALERVERLRGTGSFSQGRFDEALGSVLEARGQMAEAEARLLNAEGALAEARYRIDRAEIIAPFPGTVLSVETNPGEFIASGAPVVRLLDERALEVEARVPSRYVPSLSEGLAVSANTEDGRQLDLTVRAILPLEDIATRTRPVRLSAANGGLKGGAVGQSVTVDIPVSQARDVIAVPKDALVQASGGWTVFVAEDGMAQPRSIQIGIAMDAWFEVIDGLAPGDVVIVRGNERLRPGQPIEPMPISAGN
ncbi:MAG: efflux RND transporter periplasmic adaptor subunit [Alphaproteobacteria bacterium]|nr:efflux RND transporter periplasmic adaptor subunit [Alphaproteobacteria bacterium]